MPKKILIADNGSFFLDAALAIFDEAGYHVTIVESASRAEELAQRSFFGLIIANASLAGAAEKLKDASPLSAVALFAPAPDGGLHCRLMEESPLSTGEVLEPGSLVRAVELRSAEQRNYAERRILLLEDNDAFRSTTAEILVQEGYTVVTAATGQAALRQLRSQRFALVLSDYKLPDISGLDAARAVKQIDPPPAIIMITAYADTTIARNALREQVDDFLTKPTAPEKLLASVKGVLARKRLCRQ